MALLRPAGESWRERLGIRANLAPTPILEALFGPIQARALHVAVRTGMLARLADGPVTVGALARELELAEAPAGLVLACLAAQGHARRGRDGRWRLTRRSRRWLDPRSPASVHAYLDHTADYWSWWQRLEDLVRGGAPEAIHDLAPHDPAWRRYVLGQHELARLSAPEVARALTLTPGTKRLLDLGGAHGEFAAELCRRHPGLSATVLDLPGSVAVGREIMAGAGLADRVAFAEGDLRTAPLAGPYDVVLLFNVVHHLAGPEAGALLRRIHGALTPGGTLAVLDLFLREGDRPGPGAHLGLFFHLTSGATTPTLERLAAWLGDAGFAPPRDLPVRRLPPQRLVLARRP